MSAGAGMAPGAARFSTRLLVLLALLTFFWGINWPVLKIVLTEMAPMHFRAWCLAGGTLGLALLARLNGQSLAVPRGAWLPLAAASLFNLGLWNVLIAYGVPQMESGRAAILAFTFPVWGVIAGALIARERITASRATGVGLGLAAMLLLIGADLAAIGRAPWGALMLLGGAAGWAVGTAIGRRWPVAMPLLSLTAWQMGMAALPVVLVATLFEQGSYSLLALSVPAMSGVLYNVFVCFIFCYWAWMRLATTLPVAVSSLATLMVPIIGVASGMLVLGERPHASDWLALALVIAAFVVVSRPGAARP